MLQMYIFLNIQKIVFDLLVIKTNEKSVDIKSGVWKMWKIFPSIS